MRSPPLRLALVFDVDLGLTTRRIGNDYEIEIEIGAKVEQGLRRVVEIVGEERDRTGIPIRNVTVYTEPESALLCALARIEELEAQLAEAQRPFEYVAPGGRR